MMYTVYCDGKLLYDPRVEALTIHEPQISLEVNKAGAFDFMIYPSHPLYGQIYRMKSIIEVYQRTHLVFRGRVLNDESALFNQKKVICEGDLAYFNDSIQRPYEHAGSVEDYLTVLLTEHNAQVESNKQFVLGTVTVTDDNNYIVRSDASYPTTWEVLNSKLLNLLGGYLVIRRENDINYLDYLEDSPYTTLQTIELGSNLLDVIRDQKGEDIATAIIPIGSKISEEEGDERRLDVKSVNAGVDYIYDQDAVDAYGWIFKVVEFNDVTLPDNLLTKGREALAEAIQTNVNLELNALDRNMQDVSIDDLRIFEYVTVISLPHEIDASYLIKKMTLNLEKPENNTITIGTSYQTFIGQKLSSDAAIQTIKSDYVTNEKLNEVRSSVESISSSIEQTAEEIQTNVASTYTAKTDFETYKTEVSTSLTQTSEDFTFQFNELEQVVSDLEGETQSEFQEIQRYIRFVNGNIELGESGNPLQLVIENDAITFKQNGVSVAWFEDNNLYVKDGRFLNSIRIGDFQFTPRSNGNLSFGKVM